MKERLYKVLHWLKDHFSLILTVVFQLYIGEKKKREIAEEQESEDDSERK